ncbi:MAG: site-specific integrase [Acidimicrobiaceae bacterium]|nr:site-specific integrase [Acidimicrobiaceae bacterium]
MPGAADPDPSRARSSPPSLRGSAPSGLDQRLAVPNAAAEPRHRPARATEGVRGRADDPQACRDRRHGEEGQEVHPDLLRHSFATDYLRRGGNPILLQRILGHSSLAMITQTYQHLSFSDAQDEVMRPLASEFP